jgi:hypothetical protein
MPLVREVDPLADPRWDAYVRNHGAATAYHLGAWAAILREAYGFRPRLVSDTRLRSIPVFSYGGPLGDSPLEETALLEAAREVAEREGVGGLSVNAGTRRLEAAGFDDEEILPRWVVELPDDLDALRSGWRKTSNNLFRSLRKADRSALGFREVASGRDLRSLHLAGGVYHVFGDTIELIYNGSHERSLEMRPNHALYWGVMRWAQECGLRRIDPGGAYADTPLARFKEQWGARPQPRFRLNHRAGGEITRAESVASIGYGAVGSERRIVDFAWRHMPLTALRASAHVAYRYV